MNSHTIKILLPVQFLAIALGIFHFELTYLWYMLIGWILISGYGAAVGHHRFFSHRAFETPPVFNWILAWLAVMTSQGSPIFWTAVHRGYHHKYSDTEKDLHSPVSHSIWHSYMGWIITFDPKSITLRGAADLLRCPLQVFLHKHYTLVFWGSIAIISAIDPMVATYIFLVPAAFSQHEIGIVNVLGHMPKLGYRNHDTKDQSSNFWPLGFFGWGQGYHNNHHANPRTFNYGEKWFEFDPAKLLVYVIKR